MKQVKAFRISGDLYNAAQEQASKKGLTFSRYVESLIEKGHETQTIEEFIKSKGYIGGVYKISVDKLVTLIREYERIKNNA